MKALCTFLVLCCGLSLAHLCFSLEYGPDRTKVRSPKPQLEQLKVPVVHLGGNAAGYRVQLKHDFVQIVEMDDGTGFYFTWHQFGQLDVRKNSDGAPTWHQVRFQNARYLDLDGDGAFDVLVDVRLDRNGHVFVLFERRFVRVKGYGRGLGETMRDAAGPDGARYIFDNGAWRVANFREAAPGIERSAEHALVPRQFGPEWAKGKDPLTGLMGHLKELKVPVMHAAEGNVAIYSVQLERNRLEIGEFDDNLGFYVSWQKDGRVDIRRKSDGSPAWHQVRFRNAQYLDLGGDGIFDVFVDFRTDHEGQVFIIADNRFIAVKGNAKGVSETMRKAQTADGIEYRFDKDAWHMQSSKKD